MAAFDLQEQEQLDELKAFWASWGKFITALIVALIVAYVGRQAWASYQRSQAQAAGDAYAKVQKAFESHDPAKARATATRAAADAMVAQQARHALTSRAMLLAARAAYDAEDFDGTKSALQWVVSHSSEDSLVDIANLRLAAVLTDQKQFDAALQALQTAKVATAAGTFADARGDVLLVKGDTAGAKKAYQDAAGKLDKDSPAYQVVQTKLSALGV
jgi:predicted negative regulator of RcsB-dependent stress response